MVDDGDAVVVKDKDEALPSVLRHEDSVTTAITDGQSLKEMVDVAERRL